MGTLHTLFMKSFLKRKRMRACSRAKNRYGWGSVDQLQTKGAADRGHNGHNNQADINSPINDLGFKRNRGDNYFHGSSGVQSQSDRQCLVPAQPSQTRTDRGSENFPYTGEHNNNQYQLEVKILKEVGL